MIKTAKNILKRIGSKVKYHLDGGEYGKKMEEKDSRTPEGKAVTESVKKEGFWNTLRKSRKKGWFNE